MKPILGITITNSTQDLNTALDTIRSQAPGFAEYNTPGLLAILRCTSGNVAPSTGFLNTSSLGIISINPRDHPCQGVGVWEWHRNFQTLGNVLRINCINTFPDLQDLWARITISVHWEWHNSHSKVPWIRNAECGQPTSQHLCLQNCMISIIWLYWTLQQVCGAASIPGHCWLPLAQYWGCSKHALEAYKEVPA